MLDAFAGVAELVDARDLKSRGFGRVGSTPTPGTRCTGTSRDERGNSQYGGELPHFTEGARSSLNPGLPAARATETIEPPGGRGAGVIPNGARRRMGSGLSEAR